MTRLPDRVSRLLGSFRSMPSLNKPSGSIMSPELVQDEVLRDLDDVLGRRLRERGGAEAVEVLVASEELTATVGASIQADQGSDTRVPHRLGRVPTRVILVHPEQIGDVIFGAPGGRMGAEGGNEAPWDARAVYVRSNVPSPGRFFRLLIG